MKFKDMNKSEKLGYILYHILMISLALFIIYVFLIDDTMMTISDNIVKSYSNIGAILVSIFVIGVFVVCWVLEDILEKLFYPETDEEKEIRKKFKTRREITREYDKDKYLELEKRNLMVKAYKTEQRLKELNRQ